MQNNPTGMVVTLQIRKVRSQILQQKWNLPPYLKFLKDRFRSMEPQCKVMGTYCAQILLSLISEKVAKYLNFHQFLLKWKSSKGQIYLRFKFCQWERQAIKKMWNGFRAPASTVIFSGLVFFFFSFLFKILAFLLIDLIFQMTSFGQWGGKSFQRLRQSREIQGFMCLGL